MSNPSETLAANKAVVTEYYAALTAGDWDRAKQLVDPDGISWSLTKRETRPLPKTVDRIKTIFDETGTPMAFRIESLTAEEDRVSALVAGYAAFPDGRVYDTTFNYMIRVRDGRITLVKEYNDTALANRVLRPASAPTT